MVLRCLALLTGAVALVAPPTQPARPLTVRQGLLEPYGSGVDPFKEISTTLEIVNDSKLLTKVAKTGLLSKLDKAGYTFADAEPLLVFAEENGLVGLLGDINDDILPLLPTLVSLAPLALPLLSLALAVPSVACFAAVPVSLAGAFFVTSLPDDSVTDVALQTFLAIPLATLFPVLFGGLGVVSGSLAAK
eukprot:CAMPEP_0119272930 /NCGR_PEP_ID=MMETSP1329-20130426/9189_1 /TAXON_ID=114041 /ORGANISM="Genus nov. species nov., Strain RCC1024" /LENGTH=189 /DNA_ID=CAMNT_0007273049 /DNA_START=17 /DNA_END=583 /DNA_ORIENTATION=+